MSLPEELDLYNALPFETIDAASLWPGEDYGHHSGSRSSAVFDRLPNELVIKILHAVVFLPGETDDDWDLQFLRPTGDGMASTFGTKRGRGVQITDELRQLSLRTRPVLRVLLRVCKRWRTIMRPYSFRTLILDGIRSIDDCADRFSHAECLNQQGDTPGRWTARLIIVLHGLWECQIRDGQGWKSLQTVIRCVPHLKFISFYAKPGRRPQQDALVPDNGVPEPVMAALCLSSAISKSLRTIEFRSSYYLFGPFTPSMKNAQDFFSAFPPLVAFHSPIHLCDSVHSKIQRVTKNSAMERVGSSLASVADFLALAPLLREDEGVLPRFGPLPSLREVGIRDGGS